MKKFAKRVKLFLFYFIVLVLTIAACTAYDRFVLPSASRVCKNLAVTEINKNITQTIQEIIKQKDIDFKDFCMLEYDKYGIVSSVITDSVAVNDFCSTVADRLSERLNNSKDNTIYVKSGLFTGVSMLSDKGFNIPVKLYCTGSAMADYEIETESVGINQVNVRLWLKLETTINTYNPLLNNEINLTRKVLLTNIVYAGKVPDRLISQMK